MKVKWDYHSLSFWWTTIKWKVVFFLHIFIFFLLIIFIFFFIFLLFLLCVLSGTTGIFSYLKSTIVIFYREQLPFIIRTITVIAGWNLLEQLHRELNFSSSLNYKAMIIPNSDKSFLPIFLFLFMLKAWWYQYFLFQ